MIGSANSKQAWANKTTHLSPGVHVSKHATLQVRLGLDQPRVLSLQVLPYCPYTSPSGVVRVQKLPDDCRGDALGGGHSLELHNKRQLQQHLPHSSQCSLNLADLGLP